MNSKKNIVATGVALVTVSSAHASIVSVSLPTDLLDGNGAVNATYDMAGANQVDWDIDGDGTFDLGFAHVRNPNFPASWQTQVAVLDATGVTGLVNSAGIFGTIDTAEQIGFGDSVAGSGMVDGDGSPAIALMGIDSGFLGIIGGWGGVGDPLTTGYMGFQLSSGNYGWLEVSTGQAGVFFLGAAYDDSGADITAGTVPAPGAAALLGLGGLAAMRRRR